MLRKKIYSGKTLEHKIEIPIRFSEIDVMGIVWHGNYIKYFEDVREAFGVHYGMTYLDIYNFGFATPLVKINCEYKKMMHYGEKALVEITYIDSEAAKLVYEYKIFRGSDGELAAYGESMQVFITRSGELQLTIPDFFMEWKAKQGLIS
jgi:acyl-CoA thioester hydrolase